MYIKTQIFYCMYIFQSLFITIISVYDILEKSFESHFVDAGGATSEVATQSTSTPSTDPPGTASTDTAQNLKTQAVQLDTSNKEQNLTGSPAEGNSLGMVQSDKNESLSEQHPEYLFTGKGTVSNTGLNNPESENNSSKGFIVEGECSLTPREE